MNKFVISFLGTLLLILCLTGCACEHEWIAATCSTPKTCTICHETDGEPLSHSWQEATCIAPKKCSLCRVTEGDPLPHTPGEIQNIIDYVLAVNIEVQSCTSCGTILSSSETPISMVDGNCFSLTPEEFVARLNHIYASTNRTNWHATLEVRSDENWDGFFVVIYCDDLIYTRIFFESIENDPSTKDKTNLLSHTEINERNISKITLEIKYVDIVLNIVESTTDKIIESDTVYNDIVEQIESLYYDPNVFTDILYPIFQVLLPNMPETDICDFISNAYDISSDVSNPLINLYQHNCNDIYLEILNLILIDDVGFLVNVVTSPDLYLFESYSDWLENQE